MEIMNTHYCNNCGNYGHLYRQCKLPVLSYGILVFNVNSGTNQLLMIQRKDSISYIEFIRGKYELTNPEYIIQLFTNCSIKEKEFLKNHTFNEIWDNLWIKVTNQSERIKNEYKKSSHLFSRLLDGITYNDKKYTLQELIECSMNNYDTPEWEFPKGRRSNRESNIQCAIREFEEESGLSSNDYTLLENVSPTSETYKGSNGVNYKHVYYLAFYKGIDFKPLINSEKYEQYSEISDIQWLTIDECRAKIRPYNISKHGIITYCENFINNYQSEFTLKE